MLSLDRCPLDRQGREPFTSGHIVRTHQQGAGRFAVYEGEPRGDLLPPTVPQRIGVDVHVAQVPGNVLAKLRDSLEAHPFTGPAPGCRKIDHRQKGDIRLLEKLLEPLLAQGGHRRLHLVVR